jgi:hypothetical protein
VGAVVDKEVDVVAGIWGARSTAEVWEEVDSVAADSGGAGKVLQEGVPGVGGGVSLPITPGVF